MEEKNFDLRCPIPFNDHARILLGHGSGGILTHQLIDKIFLPAFDNPYLRQAHDGAIARFPAGRIAVTTDSYVVQPLFFPGGDIGQLAVYGCVNDLAMCGARPLYMSAGFILEEGLEIAQLQRVVDSIKMASELCRVSIITGDTKVVDKGKADGIFINTTGIGLIEHELTIAPSSLRAGDVIILSGDIGRHGVAIMTAREGLAFETTITSDAAPLSNCVLKLIAKGIPIHCLRDLTRGGLATALVELAGSSGLGIRIREKDVAVAPAVRGACEILGLDPLYVANEGRFICILPEKFAADALSILRNYLGGEACAVIGHMDQDEQKRVVLENSIGTSRVLSMLAGQLLPRIC